MSLARCRRIQRFFQSCNSVTIALRIAQVLQYLPPAVNVSVLENKIRVDVLQAGLNHYEGLEHPIDASGFVKGTRIRCPENCPETKYAALFDSRDIFDPLRRAFLMYSDPHSSTKSFLQAFESCNHAPELNEFHVALRECSVCAITDDEPTDFGTRAWATYLQCIQSSNYFFQWTHSRLYALLRKLMS